MRTKAKTQYTKPHHRSLQLVGNLVVIDPAAGVDLFRAQYFVSDAAVGNDVAVGTGSLVEVGGPAAPVIGCPAYLCIGMVCVYPSAATSVCFVSLNLSGTGDIASLM